MSWDNLHLIVKSFRYKSQLPCSKVAIIQQEILLDILNNNRFTEYGMTYHFSDIDTVESYQSKVPVVTYDDLSIQIDRMVHGETSVLCSEEVLAFEPTGGSTSGSKLIPYTASSLLSFGVALKAWLCDLLDNRPAIKAGSAYWAVSPALRSREFTPGNIPIGLESDAEYFGVSLMKDILSTLAFPVTLSTVDDFDEWRYLTLRYLLAADDLSFISVWSPTYILNLVDALKNDYQRLATDIASGCISLNKEALTVAHQSLLVADPQRADVILRACSGGTVDINALWPRLDTLSCWLHASSSSYKNQLENYFPGVYIQPKGLLATEGIVSIPMVKYGNAALTINSGFYEFVDPKGEVSLAHELVEDVIYSVLLTNNSGLYRYDIGDLVKVVGYFDSVPLLEFIGRHHSYTDICGEKLSESFVYNTMKDIQGFALLMPSHEDKKYYLFLDSSEFELSSGREAVIRLDLALKSNPQYRYARQISQLSSICSVLVNNPWDIYQNHELCNGRKLGEIKPVSLADKPSLMAALFDASKGSIQTRITRAEI